VAQVRQRVGRMCVVDDDGGPVGAVVEDLEAAGDDRARGDAPATASAGQAGGEAREGGGEGVLAEDLADHARLEGAAERVGGGSRGELHAGAGRVDLDAVGREVGSHSRSPRFGAANQRRCDVGGDRLVEEQRVRVGGVEHGDCGRARGA
jgi:hypothetical protein